MQKSDPNHTYDVIIIGSGVSGSVMAYELMKKKYVMPCPGGGGFF